MGAVLPPISGNYTKIVDMIWRLDDTRRYAKMFQLNWQDIGGTLNRVVQLSNRLACTTSLSVPCPVEHAMAIYILHKGLLFCWEPRYNND